MSVPRVWFAVIAVVVFPVTAAILRVPVASAETQGEQIVQEAKKWEGRPYCFAGGNESGPTLGIPDPEEGPDHGLFCGINGYDHSSTPGFDCTGLTIYAEYQVTKDVLVHDSYQAREAIARYHPQVITNEAELQPGDLVYFGGSLDDFVHAGIYVGGKSFISAVTEGIGVKTETMAWEEHGESFVGALRLWSGGGDSPPPPPPPGTDNGGSTIVSAASGRCLDVIGGGTTNGDHLQIWECNKAPWQHWVYVGGQLQVYGNYQKCLDADSRDGGANGTPIQIYECNGGTNQQWIAEPDGSLRSVAYGLCLDVVNGGTANGSALQLYECNGAPWQQWIGPPTPNGGGRVQSLHSNKCLDVPGASISPGTRVQSWECNGAAQQQWVYEGGQLRVYGNKCLDATNAGATNGTPIQIWYCNGAEWQQWSWEPNGTIRSRWSGLCLDSIGGGTTNGTQLQLWECNGAPWQVWFRSTETIPIVSITSQPSAETTTASATFEFTGADSGSPPVVFLCALDGAAPAPCASPTTYTNLVVGPHTLTVWGQNMVGNESTPTTYSWKVTTPPSPTTTSSGVPAGDTSSPSGLPSSSVTPAHGVLGVKQVKVGRYSALSRALANCRKIKNRHKRAKCEGAAQGRYGRKRTRLSSRSKGQR